ncbi:MAG: ATP-dependent metallopeptidase FtsH/Yme1/Tma family protein, partial [Muribaculaceae bacterium]|nr:ATP-dependent metallopeptidase FtsH/Yme1/Tma family protein [Muribaculaceae bacterium]
MGILPNKNGNSNKRPVFGMYWMYILIVACLFGLYYFQDSSQTKSVDWTEFEAAAKSGEITKIEVIPESGIAIGVLNKEGAKKQNMQDVQGPDSEKRLKTTIPSANKIQDKIDAWNEQLVADGKPEMTVKYEKGSDFMKIFWYFGPILVFVFFMVYMSRKMSGGAGGGGGIFNVGKSKARIFDKDNSTDV